MSRPIIIDRHGVHYTSPRMSLIGRVLCGVGAHIWRYWHMARSFIDTYPDEVNVCRTCDRCQWMQSTNDGVHWRARA